MKYRGDIDGLRGIAVLMVVIYHSGLPLVPGGFVGVDIFFVISGYLITAIIHSDIQSDNFSFRHFYERRIRRIIPALYAMILAVTLVSLLIEPPKELLRSAGAATAALLFSSNIYFWRTTDYFSPDTGFDYFVHTWSLGVEEQFYFVLPVVLLIFFRSRNFLFAALAAGWLTSFLFSVYTSYNHGWASYYLLPSRAWQLLTGSVLAIYCGSSVNTRTGHIATFLALICLLSPAFLYTDQTRFPGISALAPTLGAALAIYVGNSSGGKSWLTKLLNISALRGIGLISYSWYLWHWPVFAFIKNFRATPKIHEVDAVAGILASLWLAFLSWRFIEKPFRNSKFLSQRSVFSLAAVTTSMFVATFGFITLLDGLPSRLPASVIKLSETNESVILGDPCLRIDAENVRARSVCVIGDENAQPSIAFWGDSHLGALKTALTRELLSENLSGYFFSKIGCAPLPHVVKNGSSGSQSCFQFNNQVLNEILDQPTISTVVLHARWALNVNGSRYSPERGPSYTLNFNSSEGGDDCASPNDNATSVECSLSYAINRLKQRGKQVVIIASVPEVGVSVPKLEAHRRLWGKKVDIRPTRDEFERRQTLTQEMFEALGRDFNDVIVIDPVENFCDAAYCEVMSGDTPLYFDDDHLSDAGASRVVQQLMKSAGLRSRDAAVAE